MKIGTLGHIKRYASLISSISCKDIVDREKEGSFNVYMECLHINKIVIYTILVMIFKNSV